MRSAPRVPPERTWWIEPERLLGGIYPGDRTPALARAKLDALLDLGIRAFANLTEADERGRGGIAFVPYEPIVASLARARGIEIATARFPIVDQKVPSIERMDEVMAWLDERLARGEPCYVHCWGGRGRTGTVAGVHLIRRGFATSATFVEVIRALRVDESLIGDAPENDEQRNFVRAYAREAT